MAAENYSSVHLLVSGRVQGVGFRFFTINHANRYGLTGWVKNLPNGSVEILAEGSPEALSLFVERVQEGPSSARISDVQADWQDIPAPRHRGFTISY